MNQKQDNAAASDNGQYVKRLVVLTAQNVGDVMFGPRPLVCRTDDVLTAAIQAIDRDARDTINAALTMVANRSTHAGPSTITNQSLLGAAAR